MNESDVFALCGRPLATIECVLGTPDAPYNATGAQVYLERPPAAVLAPYVSAVWVQWVVPGAEPYEHRTVPNGGVELVCELGSVPRVVGPQTGPTTETLAPGATVVGVRFRPGAAPPALGLPASELVDLAVHAGDVWGGSVGALGEELSASSSPDRAAVVLERAIVDRLGRQSSPGPDPIVAEAVRRLSPWREDDVRSLARSLFISERQLRRRCLAAIGLAPKPLQRMLRFQGFLALTHANGLTGTELADLAADCGYADQPHLTRESLRLSGKTPQALLREAEERCRGAHDHAASYAPLLRMRALRDAA